MPYISHVKLNVYNILGEKLVTIFDGNVSTGYKKIRYDASNLSSGIYFYSLNYEDKQITKKFILVK